MKKRIWAAALLLVFLIPFVAVATATGTRSDHDDHVNEGRAQLCSRGARQSRVRIS